MDIMDSLQRQLFSSMPNVIPPPWFVSSQTTFFSDYGLSAAAILFVYANVIPAPWFVSSRTIFSSDYEHYGFSAGPIIFVYAVTLSSVLKLPAVYDYPR